MYVVAVNFEIHETSIEEFMTIMKRQAQNSLTREPGCQQFDVSVSTDDPLQVFLYEVYDDRAAFEEHLQTEHFKEFDERSKPLFKSKSAQFFNRIC